MLQQCCAPLFFLLIYCCNHVIKCLQKQRFCNVTQDVAPQLPPHLVLCQQSPQTHCQENFPLIGIIMSQQPLLPFRMTTCGRRTRSATLIWLPLKQSGAHGLDKTGLEGRTGWRSSGCTLATVHSIESLLRHLAPRAVYFWPSHRHSTLRSLYWLRDDVISMRTPLDNVSEEFPCFIR